MTRARQAHLRARTTAPCDGPRGGIAKTGRDTTELAQPPTSPYVLHSPKSSWSAAAWRA